MISSLILPSWWPPHPIDCPPSPSPTMAPAPSSFSLSLLLFLFLFRSVAVAFAGGSAVDLSDEKFTHLHFYFHETRSGPNMTVVNYKSLTSDPAAFAYICVFDNYMREGPDPGSALLGRAQGIGAFAFPDGRSGLLTATNFVFMAGEYNGSTLTMLGMYKESGVAERPIVGGSGRFRMARGYSLGTIVSFSDARLVAKFNIYVKHY